MIPKRSGREGSTARGAVEPMGTLSRGSPQDAVLPLPPTKQNPHQREETQKRFDSLTRFCAPDKSEVRHAAISPKLRPRFPRAACGPPLPIFGLRPRRNGVGFRFLRKARRGFAPSIPTSLLKKAGPKTFFANVSEVILQTLLHLRLPGYRFNLYPAIPIPYWTNPPLSGIISSDKAKELIKR